MEHILRAKQWLVILEPPQVDVEAVASIVGAPDHRAVLDEVMRGAEA